jgi:hypothetical protein
MFFDRLVLLAGRTLSAAASHRRAACVSRASCRQSDASVSHADARGRTAQTRRVCQALLGRPSQMGGRRQSDVGRSGEEFPRGRWCRARNCVRPYGGHPGTKLSAGQPRRGLPGRADRRLGRPPCCNRFASAVSALRWDLHGWLWRDTNISSDDAASSVSHCPSAFRRSQEARVE